jgi:glycerate kinase
VRVIIAPDSFGGTLSAAAAARAIADGWTRRAPADDLSCCALSDGGPGFVDAIAASLDLEVAQVSVVGPMGEEVEASYAVSGDTAYLEAAQACGLQLVPEGERNPEHTSSFGLGELMLAARDDGARKMVIGLGGTGTNDAGAGMLAALGATADGPLDSGGRPLRRLTEVNLRPALAAMRGVEIVAASDVDIPLLGVRGATKGFGPQKGASEEQVSLLEGALQNFAELCGPDERGKRPALAAGAGAAGGIGFALGHLGATRAPGIATVMEIVGFARLLAAADVVITGEGRFDWQSLRGKVVSGVAAVALDHALPCVVIAGQVAIGRREYSAIGVAAAYSVAEVAGSIAASMADPAGTLADTGERVARTWSR